MKQKVREEEVLNVFLKQFNKLYLKNIELCQNADRTALIRMPVCAQILVFNTVKSRFK